ncbi:carbamoyl-phosphate synthase domain-containing protein [Buchnera aphidicola]|uniref:carbamoyl-phosphate synthase domain-containing protein n=1 Tax=Buchnera aphidicola TaxID=9 RepID=UPI0034641567
MKEDACLTLEDGSFFKETAIGLHGTTFSEVVFNTSMTDYQKIITDTSYKNQIITFTYPNIGNTGINNHDNESRSIKIQGIIIKNLSLIYSNYKNTTSFEQYLKDNNIVGIANIDTRKLTHTLRIKGN